MKTPIVVTLIAVILVVTAILAACSSAPADNAIGVPATTASAPPRFAVTAVKVVNDDERLGTIQSSIGVLINQSLNRGETVPEYLFEQTWKIKEAREALRQLDGQHEGLSMLVMQYCAAGDIAPDCVFDLMNSIKESKKETLKEIGLYQ